MIKVLEKQNPTGRSKNLKKISLPLKKKFKLSDKEFSHIIDSLDETGGYLIKEFELRYWIEYYVNKYHKLN